MEEVPLEFSEDANSTDLELLLARAEVDLASEGEVLDDDDLVLGGSDSGSGSDITIAGDSGISLVDPNDSGLYASHNFLLEITLNHGHIGRPELMQAFSVGTQVDGSERMSFMARSATERSRPRRNHRQPSPPG